MDQNISKYLKQNLFQACITQKKDLKMMSYLNIKKQLELITFREKKINSVLQLWLDCFQTYQFQVFK